MQVRDTDGAWSVAGPTLPLSYLADDGREIADALFGSAPDQLDENWLAELVSRMEQLTIDRLYASPLSKRAAVRAHVVLAWAILVTQRLVDGVEPTDGESLRARLDRLAGLAASEGLHPLATLDIPTVAPDGDLTNFRAERRITRQIAMYVRRKRILRRANEVQDAVASAVYDRPPEDHRREIARRIGDNLKKIGDAGSVVSAATMQRYAAAREALSVGDLPDESASSVREIELHPFRNRWALFYEIASGIAFTTFSSAGSFVFLGTRLQKCTGVCQAGGVEGFSASLDIIALVICSFGFLFATLAYANGTGVLARFSTMGYTESVERGNRISEYFGVYPLIFAIPLAVEQSTGDPIPAIVKAVGLISFLGYHWASGFSLLERVVASDALGTDRKRRLTVTTLVALLAIVWFAPSFVDGNTGLWIRLGASAAFLVLLTVIYLLASIVPEQGRPSRYRVHRDDVISDESPSLGDLRPSRAGEPTSAVGPPPRE